MKHLVGIVFIFLLGVACASSHKEGPVAGEREMTVGLVQKEIRKGISQADVAEALGSPNIVTKDNSEKEVWIHDRIAGEASYSHSNAYGTILLLGFSRDKGYERHSQKTLTVIIRFDRRGRVDTFSYHATKF